MSTDNVNTIELRIIVNGLGIGGTETHLSRVLPILMNEYGYSIKLFLLSDCLDLAPPLQNAGISIWYPRVSMTLKRLLGRKITRFLQTFMSFWRLVWDFCIDRKRITHFFLARSYLVGMTAAMLTRLPSDKYMSRRSLNDYQNSVVGVRWLESVFHEKVKKIWVNSDKITAQLVEEENVLPEKVIKIYNGLQPISTCYQDRQRYRQTLMQAENIPQDAWIFITVANLIPYKGHEHLLKALAQLKLQAAGGRSWCLLCVGTDAGSGYAATLRQQAENLGIGDKIRWLGKQSDVFALYAGSDIGFLCPYRNEGFSNALLEGMAIGLPFIVTDVGGNSEAVVHEETGLVVPPSDPDRIANAVKILCQQPQLCAAFGARARQRVEQHFSLAECVAGYDAAYRQAMEMDPAVIAVG